MAVAMIGSGAAVALYSGQRETAEKAVARINQSAAASMSLALVVGGGDPFEPVPQDPNPLLNTSIESTSSITARNRIEATRLKNQVYICVYVYIYVYIYKSICIFIYMYIYILYIYICIYKYLYESEFKLKYILVYIQIRICTGYGLHL
jgi:hypothetical protein